MQELLQGWIPALEELIPQLVVGDAGEDAEDDDVVDLDAAEIGLVPMLAKRYIELIKALSFTLRKAKELEALGVHGVDLVEVLGEVAEARVSGGVPVIQDRGGVGNAMPHLCGNDVVQAVEEEGLLFRDVADLQTGGAVEGAVAALPLRELYRS